MCITQAGDRNLFVVHFRLTVKATSCCRPECRPSTSIRAFLVVTKATTQTLSNPPPPPRVLINIKTPSILQIKLATTHQRGVTRRTYGVESGVERWGRNGRDALTLLYLENYEKHTIAYAVTKRP